MDLPVNVSDTIISLLPKAEAKRSSVISVFSIINQITTDSKLQKKIDHLRTLTGEEYDIQKLLLPGVTWSARLNGKGKNESDIEQHSGLFCVDFDKLNSNRLNKLWEKIINDEYTCIAFVSPSGKGLKVVVKVPADIKQHRLAYYLLNEYYLNKHGYSVDLKCKDPNRLCFLSYHEGLYFNPDSTRLFIPSTAKLEDYENDALLQPVKKVNATITNAGPETLDEIYKFTENKERYESGNHNSFIYLFAANCNRKGIDINDCLNYVISFASNKPQKEVFATVESAYKHHTAEFAKFAKRTTKQPESFAAVQQTNAAGELPQKNLQFDKEPGANDYEQFWFEQTVTDKNGKEKTTIEISYRSLIIFLSQNGYYRLQVSENGYELIHYENNIVKRVQAYQVRDFVVKWATARKMWGLEEKLRRAGKTALSNDQINTLPFINIEFKKDTNDAAFFYFANCWVKVTAKNVTTHEYSQLDAAIWATQIKAREFTKLDNWFINLDEPDKFTCEYARFLALTSHNIKGDESNDVQFRLDRFDSFCTSFGYLLHSFKNPSNAKMILSIDHKLGEKGEQNGGSGKSLAGKAVAELKHTTNISGKDFKEEYPFKYEQVTPDSQLVSFNDLKRNFNMECLFEIITGDFTVNRRNIGYLVLPFETSPKVYANTNFIPPGEGSSFIRRTHVIEFSDYFTEEYTPFDEFGHTLFQDWNDEEWNRFYNFMLTNCVSLYLQKGLVKYPGSNFDQRKLQSEVPDEFIDFLEQKDAAGDFIISRNVCHRKVDLIKRFKDYTEGTGLKDPTAHSFTKWIKKYCKTKGYTWNAHSNGKRDSSGPMGEFISICDAKYNQAECLASRGSLFHNQSK